MNHIYWYPHSKKAEFYKLLLDYDESLERDLADCGAIWYESWTQNLMTWDCWMSDRIASMIISKRFWFITWFLDNEKLDLLRLSCTAIRYTEIIDADFSREDRIIMILAIQDNPIKFLIDYLK